MTDRSARVGPSPTPSPDEGELATTSDDYGASYYRSGLGPPYEASEAHWGTFFGGVAAAIVAACSPTTSLDAGCAKGFLVKAMLDLGVDARGVDVSHYAIEAADPSLSGRLAVHDLTQPLDGRFDVITCIEVLEHMAPADAETAIDRLCEATDLVVLASTPHDFVEPTHVNVRTPAEWAASFARRGFFRRPDVDLAVLAPWAVLFERRRLAPADVVHLYEELLAPTREEAVVKTAALLDAQRRLDEMASDVPIPGGANQLDRMLGLLDQVMGLQAELAAVRADAEAASARARASDLRPAAWTAGRSRASLETELSRERELRQGLERRVRAAEAALRAHDDLQRSRAFRAASSVARVARGVRRIGR